MEFISWDRRGWRPHGLADDEGEATYVNDEGDTATESWTPESDLQEMLADEDGLQRELAVAIAESGGGLISVDLLDLDGAQAARQLIKAPDESGTVYIGSFIIPRTDGCLSLSFTCSEDQSWRRAAAVEDMLIAERGIDAIDSFAGHPYAREATGGMPRDASDDADYDDDFPDHALSRCRRYLEVARASFGVRAEPDITGHPPVPEQGTVDEQAAGPAEIAPARPELPELPEPAAGTTGSTIGSAEASAEQIDYGSGLADALDAITRRLPAWPEPADASQQPAAPAPAPAPAPAAASAAAAPPPPPPAAAAAAAAPPSSAASSAPPSSAPSSAPPPLKAKYEPKPPPAGASAPSTASTASTASTRRTGRVRRPLRWDLPGWRELETDVWGNRDDDIIVVTGFSISPDLPADLDRLADLRHGLAVLSADFGAGLIEAEVCPIDGLPALRRVVKLPKPDGSPGLVYLGSYTIPRADSSVVLRVQCEETDEFGDREQAAYAEFLQRYGGDEQAAAPHWASHPYAPEIEGGTPPNHADDPLYDVDFPDHPLARCRRLLAELAATIRLAPQFKQQPPFRLDEPLTERAEQSWRPAVQHITWNRTGWNGPVDSPHGGEEIGYVNADGDVAVELIAYEQPPLPAPLDELAQMRHRLGRLTARDGYQLLELEPDEIDGLPAIWQLLDAPSQQVFCGSFTIPRADAWILVGFICDKGDDPDGAIYRCHQLMLTIGAQLRLPLAFKQHPPFRKAGGKTRLGYPAAVLTGDVPMSDAVPQTYERPRVIPALMTREDPGAARGRTGAGRLNQSRLRKLAASLRLGRGEPSADSQVRWNRVGFRMVRSGVYENPAGDTVTEIRATSPLVPAPMDDLGLLRRELVTQIAGQGAGVIEADLVRVDGLAALQHIVKMPANNGGMVYRGVLTIPRENAAIQLNVQCRETAEAVAARAAVLASGHRRDSDREPAAPGSHPYAPQTQGGAPRHPSDDQRYDSDFPKHGLSRCRRLLAAIAPTVQLAPAFKVLTGYGGTDLPDEPDAAAVQASPGSPVSELPMSWPRAGWTQFEPGKYVNADDDIVVESCDDEPAFLFAPLDDLPTIRKELAIVLAEAGGGLIEADTCSVDGLPAVRQIYKREFSDVAGIVYVGGLVIPRATASLHLKVQCQDEDGTGDEREQAVLDQLLAQRGPQAAMDWAMHPYVDHAGGGLPRNAADDRTYDDYFPNHPLSRCRRLLDDLIPEIRLDRDFAALPTWRGPQLRG